MLFFSLKNMFRKTKICCTLFFNKILELSQRHASS